MLRVIIIVLVFLLGPVYAENWAVLVAGSVGYHNYRHQADVCWAYHVLKKNGFTDDKIIVFMYDDIAQNPANPNKGEIVSAQGGPNLYKDVPKDYTGNACTKENLFKVLSGDESAGGKVLKSGSEDNVFLYYADHGGVGMLSMPVGGLLYGDELVKVMQSMYARNAFKGLVVYIEACNSGSLFEMLPNDLRIYATTAANRAQSSFACNYDPSRHTFLGDTFSVSFLSDLQQAKLDVETVNQEYNIIKEETHMSEVCRFGDLRLGPEPLSDFFGHRLRSEEPVKPNEETVSDCFHVKADMLQRRLATTKSGSDLLLTEAELSTVLLENKKVDELFQFIDNVFHTRVNLQSYQEAPRDFDCLRHVISTYETVCGKMSEYALKYTGVLVNLCESPMVALAEIQETITTGCVAHMVSGL